ncbi:MAG TPA: hypothetical protein VGQ11_02535 [Candidatus Acidoferrales bacterium]|nr:hypothetical protein [Candidatus Acidoferrales bacterium]
MKRLVISVGAQIALSAALALTTFAQEPPHQHPGTPPAQKEKSQPAPAQHQHSGAQQPMEGMQHRGMHQPDTLIEAITQHSGAGTSVEPISTPAHMLMATRGKWTLMFHGVAFLNALQQSGPRGYDKVFSTNWLMPMAQRRLGRGTFTARAMLSFEPATITRRSYPEIFQVGETAYGRALVDAQHPHDFFMELAFLYDLNIAENALLSFYFAPVGDPAIGPTAFPHRSSASENPLAPLGHHLQDSTHIASDVITAGLTYKRVRLEASGFHGREPDELRWNIDAGKLDSWSTRLTIAPAKNWIAQYSLTRLASPEELNPDEDVLRMTASVSYNRPLTGGNWSTLLLWGRNRTSPGGEIFNSYLLESTLRFREKNSVWGRVESADRTNQLLLGKNPAPPGFAEHFLARVQAVTLGYDREFELVPRLSTALGGQVTFDAVPSPLRAIYGAHPVGVILFLRLRPAGH